MKDKPRSESGKPKAEAKDPSANNNSQIDATSRARNKTVMLTPEVTGQLRSLLNKDDSADLDSAGSNSGTDSTLSSSSSSLSPNSDAGGGWQAPLGSKKGVSVNPVMNNVAPTQANPVVNQAKPVEPQASRRPVAPQQQSRPVTPQPRPVAPQVKPVAQVPNPAPTVQTGAPLAAHGLMPRSPMTQVTSPQQQQPVAAPSANVQANNAAAPVRKARKSKLVGFLLSYDSSKFGEVFELHSGRWLLTSRVTGQEDSILVADESISALHAIIRATEDGKIQILDQLSEFGTGVTAQGKSEEEDVSGSMVTVNHGDMVRFGKRHFVVCLVPPYRAPKTKEEASE